MKVLLSAYACEPGRGTEPGVGWNTAWEIAKYQEVWVLTRPDDGREAIEAELQRNPNPNLHFVYFTLPIFGSLWRKGSIAFLIHYYFWQLQAFFVARRLHAEIGFDVAHHVTFVRHSAPSFLTLLPIPLIWGPVGGGESAPAAFWQDFSWRNKVYEVLRIAARWVGERDPFARMTAQHSTIVRATTEDTAIRIRQMGAQQVEIYPEASLTKEEIVRLTQCDRDPPVVRFISMGRLLHWKGFHLGLRAFAQADLLDAEYLVLGDGPDRQRLEDLAIELGIADRVKFVNRLPRDEALQQLGSCTALVHPSLHDSGGWVCLEAMMAARPVICLNLGGPAIQVTAETGVRVDAPDPDGATRGLAAAMVKLATDPSLCLSMGRAGQRRVKEFYNWESRGPQICQLYEDVVTANLLPSGSIVR
ncbi:glycosyltransferase [Chamaesiphon sp. OTE_75_metabat_556]|uniref:glycosyltransferase family 4 protein n=1 Tax=Chamaesiphon sp. OTE_75_metabat_556 TaxID=2964692 RepID=UPI00286C5D97|nr:glycosyltransferase [Chamaesiphon sp. OTE_75_metabat_556]